MAKFVLRQIQQIYLNKWIFIICFVLSIIFVSIFSTTTSPFYLDEGTDSAVFKTMGKVILDGRIPYVDYFDHKGPILYFINALGQWLVPNRMGIFFLQIIVNFIVFIFAYKVAHLFLQEYSSCFVLLLLCALYSIIYGGGNHCEEWELLITMPLLYYSLLVIRRIRSSYIHQDAIKLGVIYGLCLAYVFYLRPNDAVSQVGASITGISILLLTRKDYLSLGYYLMMVFVGSLIISVPIFSYFAIHHSISDFWYGMVLHNQLYVGGSILQMFTISSGKLPFVIISILVVCLSLLIDKHILYISIPYVIFSILMLGPRQYDYYFIANLPLFLLLFILIFVCQKQIITIGSILITMVCFTYNKKWGPTDFFVNSKKKINAIVTQDASQRLFYSQSEKLFSKIPINQQDDVWNYNLGFSQKGEHYSYTSIFFHNNIIQCNRVPLYYMCFIDPLLNEFDDLCTKKPSWILLTHEVDDDETEFEYFKPGYDFIEENYDFVYRTDTTICDIELWRRRDATDNNLLKETL